MPVNPIKLNYRDMLETDIDNYAYNHLQQQLGVEIELLKTQYNNQNINYNAELTQTIIDLQFFESKIYLEQIYYQFIESSINMGQYPYEFNLNVLKTLLINYELYIPPHFKHRFNQNVQRMQKYYEKNQQFVIDTVLLNFTFKPQIATSEQVKLSELMHKQPISLPTTKISDYLDKRYIEQQLAHLKQIPINNAEDDIEQFRVMYYWQLAHVIRNEIRIWNQIFNRTYQRSRKNGQVNIDLIESIIKNRKQKAIDHVKKLLQK